MPKILDSTSMDYSCMDNSVFDLLSLRRREKSTSNALAYVILAEASVGSISSGILPYILLNLLVKLEIDSPFFPFKAPNSMM
jgi:hypothetical protein